MPVENCDKMDSYLAVCRKFITTLHCCSSKKEMEIELKIWLQCTFFYELMWLFHFLSLLISLSVLYFSLLFILFNSLAIFHFLCLCAVFSTATISAVSPSHDYFLLLLSIFTLTRDSLWLYISYFSPFPDDSCGSSSSLSEWCCFQLFFTNQSMFTLVSNLFSLLFIGSTSGILNWKTETAVTKQTPQAFPLHLFIRNQNFL